LYNSGARVSEIAAIRRSQIAFNSTTSLVLHGKGRKERRVPLWAKTARILETWLKEIGDAPDGFVFPNARGGPLTRDGVSYILDQAVDVAAERCLSLRGKHVTPHIVRHTTAMHLLQSGVECSVIALWLGHESLETTHIYLEADLATKETALGKLAPPGTTVRRFKATDALLNFLAKL
jgi:site-specific recombinase XerD